MVKKLKTKDFIRSSYKNIYVIVFLIFFIPRIVSLGNDIANYDSSYWYPRMDNFTKYLLRGEYKQTYQKYHPGVTLLLTSGFSKYTFEKTFELATGFSPRYMPHQFTRLHFATKFPLVLLITLIGVWQFDLISKIANKKLGILFAIVLSLEPFFLGVSKFVHLSALTSMLMFLSFLLIYYHYNSKQKDRRYFYFSAIALGLGALTKIDAIIAAPVNALIIAYFEYTKSSSSFTKRIKEVAKSGLLYSLASFGIFYIFFPAMWVAPIWTIRKIIGDGIQDTAFSSSGADTLTGFKYMFYPEQIIFRSLPTTVIAFIGGLILTIKSSLKKKKKENKADLFGWTAFYFFVNIIILSIPDKIKDRYLINLSPAIALFAAVFLAHIWDVKNKIIKFSVIGIFGFFYLLTIYKYHPVYSFYYSELIGGPGGYERLGLPVKNRGEFYAQAALYINKNDSNPEVRNVVLSHREQMRTFRPFFVGETFTNPGLLKEGYFADYIITRPDSDYLITDSPLKDKCKLEKAFGPKAPLKYDIVKLYKCNGVTNKYKDFAN